MVAVASKTPVRAYGPAQLPSSSATRYTVPSGKIAVIRHIRVINPTAGAVTFTISIGADAPETRLFSARTIAAGGEFDHIGYWVLGQGDVIQANASAATSLVMTVFGDEYGSFPDNGAGNTSVSQPVNLSTSSITAATAVADASTAHTKGAWVELVASTPFRARRVQIMMAGIGLSNTNKACLADFGTGAAGLETVLVSNINHGSFLLTGVLRAIHTFDLDIPAGTRLAMRVQSIVLSQAVPCSVRLYAEGGVSDSATAVTTYGDVAASSIGTVPASPGAINTKGAWTEVTAATTSAHGRLNVSFGLASTNSTSCSGLLDVGYGPSGSEVVIMPDIPYNVTAGEEVLALLALCSARVNLPSGVRLAVRIQSNSVTGTFKPSVCLHGFGALVT